MMTKGAKEEDWVERGESEAVLQEQEVDILAEARLSDVHIQAYKYESRN